MRFFHSFDGMKDTFRMKVRSRLCRLPTPPTAVVLEERHSRYHTAVCLCSELHFRSFGSTLFGFEIGLFLKAKHAGKDVIGESTYRLVVRLGGFVE